MPLAILLLKVRTVSSWQPAMSMIGIRKEKMIWSCEINYHGWEDDIHHHHFFIKDDARPSEQAVVDCYNANYYDPDDWEFNEHIEPLEDDEYSNWQAIEPNGYNYENVRIIIKPLKVEKLDGSI